MDMTAFISIFLCVGIIMWALRSEQKKRDRLRRTQAKLDALFTKHTSQHIE
jgi:hypothetical protein